VALIPAIEQLRNGIEFVTDSSGTEIQRLTERYDQLLKVNQNLVLERDKSRLKVVELETQVRELKRQPDKLRAEITRLKHLEHDCQAIKANGDRCDRLAKGKVDFHGVLINVCLQHQNQLMKK
jgi:prefoldin subunit 5